MAWTPPSEEKQIADTKRIFLGEPEKREGAMAFYIEKPSLGYVRVSDIRVDDWGVKLLATRVRVPGFELEGWGEREQVELGSRWIGFSSGRSQWGFYGYWGWELFFDPFIITEMCAIATDVADKGHPLDYGRGRRFIEKLRDKNPADWDRDKMISETF